MAGVDVAPAVDGGTGLVSAGPGVRVGLEEAVVAAGAVGGTVMTGPGGVDGEVESSPEHEPTMTTTVTRTSDAPRGTLPSLQAETLRVRCAGLVGRCGELGGPSWWS